MKSPLIAPLASVLLLFAACEQKSAQVTSSAPPPSQTPAEATETPDNLAMSPSSSEEASPTAEATISPSATGTSNRQPVFRNEAATQAANQYLNSYKTILNDVTAAPRTHPAISTDPIAAIEGAENQLRKLGQDTAQLENRQQEVDQQLTPDEKKRLLQYQKNFERAGRPNQD